MKDEGVLPCSRHEAFILHPSCFILSVSRSDLYALRQPRPSNLGHEVRVAQARRRVVAIAGLEQRQEQWYLALVDLDMGPAGGCAARGLRLLRVADETEKELRHLAGCLGNAKLP